MKNKHKKNKWHWQLYLDKPNDKMPYKYVIEMLYYIIDGSKAHNANWTPSNAKDYYNEDKNNYILQLINNDTKLLFEYLLDKFVLFDNEESFFKWYKHNRRRFKRLYKKYTGFKWLYRLESKSEFNGLWYDANNNYVWGIGKLENCKTKDLPMDYDYRYHKNGKNWFSSCSNKEDLAHWYSLKDAQDLIQSDFVFTKYLACEFCEYELETCFLKETCFAREEISVEDIMGTKLEN